MRIEELAERAHKVLDEVERAVIGKREALELVLLGMLADGHVLLEDFPGLAKTLIARAFAQVTSIGFTRIQFTPDLMPSDVTGSSIFNQREIDFEFRPGPIFTNLLLADEINRAPPKTQAALLEAMQERQVTIGEETFPLPDPFLVLATQNPIEQEGTYPLPEAQVDRFMLKLRIGYPSREEERQILDRMATTGEPRAASPVIHRLSPPGSAVLPSRLAASLTVTQGRPRVMREMKPAFSSRASCSSTPPSAGMPAAAIRPAPPPSTRGFGSRIA